MRPADHRQFWRLFALSLVLHGAIFAAMQSPWSKQSKPLPPIIASFKLNVAPTPEVEQPRERQPVAEPKVTTPRKTPPPEQRQPAVRPVLQADKGSDMKLAPAPSGPAAVAPAAQPVAVAPSPPASAPALQAARAQPDALASYRQQLSELFAGRQSYPRLAAMRGWEGEVRLRLKVARKGNLVSIAIDHSSGFEVLDKSALAMVEGIPALPEFPDSLGDTEIQIVVPVSYKLRKTT